MADHGLNQTQLDIIRSVLAPFSAKIDRVALFGSRAAGTQRPSSDIDIVIYGSLDEPDVDRIWTLFDSSNLPFKVDVNAYNLVTYPPLRDHIDSAAETLLTKTDLDPG